MARSYIGDVEGYTILNGALIVGAGILLASFLSSGAEDTPSTPIAPTEDTANTKVMTEQPVTAPMVLKPRSNAS